MPAVYSPPAASPATGTGGKAQRIDGEVSPEVAAPVTQRAALDALEAPLPEPVARGLEPFLIVDAVAGG